MVCCQFKRKRSNLIKIRSLRSLLKDLMKPHIKVKYGDLSIMHDHIVMPRHKLSADWLNTNVTKQGFVRSFSSYLTERFKGYNFNQIENIIFVIKYRYSYDINTANMHRMMNNTDTKSVNFRGYKNKLNAP